MIRKPTKAFCWGLNILMPGLGHAFLGEYTFGIFVFLITLIGAILFIASYFMTIPTVGRVFLFGLPLLFYIFTFFDLSRSVRTKGQSLVRSRRATVIMLLIGHFYQMFAPPAVVNFLLRNRPQVAQIGDNRLVPRLDEGSVVIVNRLAYRLNLVGFEHPILHSLPARNDVIRLRQDDSSLAFGVVLGLPTEQIEVVGGIPIINGIPHRELKPLGVPLHGDWPLVTVGSFSLLVATFRLGNIEQLYQVPIDRIVGRVSELF